MLYGFRAPLPQLLSVTYSRNFSVLSLESTSIQFPWPFSHGVSLPPCFQCPFSSWFSLSLLLLSNWLRKDRIRPPPAGIVLEFQIQIVNCFFFFFACSDTSGNTRTGTGHGLWHLHPPCLSFHSSSFLLSVKQDKRRPLILPLLTSELEPTKHKPPSVFRTPLPLPPPLCDYLCIHASLFLGSTILNTSKPYPFSSISTTQSLLYTNYVWNLTQAPLSLKFSLALLPLKQWISNFN